jgi:hypothetical protein
MSHKYSHLIYFTYHDSLSFVETEYTKTNIKI